MTNTLIEDIEFVKPSEVQKYPTRTSIQHWQLRDLLTCPISKKEFIYVNQNLVNVYNTESKNTTSLLKELAFSPTSITSGCGYVAVGGQRSQLVVKSLTSTWQASTAVGGSINNALCISEHLNDTRILVSNNDESIKVYSIPTLARVTDITLPTAVNYGNNGFALHSNPKASASPDGRKLAVVGDTNQVFLYEISAAAGYRRIGTYTTSNDAGFNCAWNQSSDKFAVAAQDGYVSVWDIRSSEKLAKLQSKQNPQVKGACRSVKFSPSGSIDLLLFSEHVSYVNLVDARTFNHRQVIRVSPPNTDHHISGICFSPDSQSAFVGLENVVLEYGIDTKLRRTFPFGSII